MSDTNQVPMEQNYTLEPWDDDPMWCEIMQTLTSEKDHGDITDPMLPEGPLDLGELPLDAWFSISESLYGFDNFGLGDMHNHSGSLTMTSSDFDRSPQTSLPEWSPEPVTSCPEYPGNRVFDVQARPTYMTDQVIMAPRVNRNPNALDNGQNIPSKWICQSCGYDGKTKRDLRRHINSCNPDLAKAKGFYTEKTRCPYCSKSFTRNDNLRRHMKNKHGVP